MSTKWFGTYFSKWFSEWWFAPLEVSDIPRQRIDYGGVVESTAAVLTVTAGEAPQSLTDGSPVPVVSFIEGIGETGSETATRATVTAYGVTSAGSGLTVTDGADNLVVIRNEAGLEETNGDETFSATRSAGALSVTSADGGL